MNPINIADRRELFVDDYLVEETAGALRRVFHHPVPRDIVMTLDHPWEGNVSGYFTVFRDNDTYRMYYRGGNYTIQDGKLSNTHPHVVCYAESKDGLDWHKPDLGLIEFDGSTKNNIVMSGDGVGNGVVFRDLNPQARSDARYKAIGTGADHRGQNIGGGHCVYALKSADGIHWEKMCADPVYDKSHRGLSEVPGEQVLTWLDSQNTAFWSPHEQCYVMYYRVYTYDGEVQYPGWTRPDDYLQKRVRHIEKAVSDDFVNWTRVGLLDCGADMPCVEQQFYTNVIAPYYRAPHIYIGMPGRYTDPGWTQSHDHLPDLQRRKTESEVALRAGTALTDTLLMWSRDGQRFRIGDETFLRPGPQRSGSWMYGDAWVNWHLVETRSDDDHPQLSLYSGDFYRIGAVRLRHYTLRVDGFASLHANRDGGRFVTRPVDFQGDRLTLNFATSAAGSVRVEIQHSDGSAIDGFTLEDCDEVIGDELDRTVTWRGNSDVSALAGDPVRMRFELKDADVYAFQFSL